jgi:cystine transport system substrate-binding protein
VDFANELAKHLGVKADLKPTKWDGMLASLDSKRIDVVINQVTISDQRKKNMTSLRRTPSPDSGAGEER